jgi:hypothetical protein
LNPVYTAFAPFYNPSIIFFGFFNFCFSLNFSKSLSKHNTVNPDDILPVILPTELKAPPTVCATNDPAP